jgi:hypothetical protein
MQQFPKVLMFDSNSSVHCNGKILGGGMVGAHAGDMFGEIAEVAHGNGTDLLPGKIVNLKRHFGENNSHNPHTKSALSYKKYSK